MLTKYTIEIDGTTTEIPQQCVKNWEDIECAYSRSDYSGVARSFTTKFEFVGEAYDMLMGLYLRDGFNAAAVLAVYTLTDTWGWEKRFSAPLDFSSVSWDNYTLSVNCVDNGLAAIIKANKGTKYEFAVGTDIEGDKVMAFNRLPVQESLTYEYTGGDSEEDGSLVTPVPENDRVYMGVLSDDEISVGGAVEWNDDQTTEDGSWMLRALKALEIGIEVEVVSDRCYSTGIGVGAENPYSSLTCTIVKRNNAGEQTVIGQFTFGPERMIFCGYHDTADELRTEYPEEKYYVKGEIRTNMWAVVNGEAWQVTYRISAEHSGWEGQGVDEATFRRAAVTRSYKATLAQDERIAILTTYDSGGKARLYSSKFQFTWITKGSACSMPVFKPASVGALLLRKMCAGNLNPLLTISSHDSRLASTYLVAAESIRGIEGAKLYSTFTEFCDWMETVFGYTYYFDDEATSPFLYHRYALGGYIGTPYPLITTVPGWSEVNDTPPTEEQIVYLEAYGKFAAFDGTHYYAYFPDSGNYNTSLNSGCARTDTIFTITRHGEQRHYYFNKTSTSQIDKVGVEYEGDIADYGKPFQRVHFVHRSELFSPDATVRHYDNVRDVSYSVDTGSIYSTVTIGYAEQDYDSINGRDEFNFSNTYSTGCTVSDKKLSLESKYRADCYGMEFAAQKRGADTTDSDSDDDLFFVLCTENGDGTLIPDTSAVVEGALSDEVFNAAFSPMACVAANAGYIGMQSSALHLSFASSEGNSGIVIDGVSVTADIDISEPLMTCGLLTFTTDDLEEPAGTGDLIEVESGGVTYRGFLQEATFKYANNEAVEYTIIVKDIEI